MPIVPSVPGVPPAFLEGDENEFSDGWAGWDGVEPLAIDQRA